MRKALLAAICLLTTLGWGQGVVATSVPTVSNGVGQPIAGATVAICVSDPGTSPSLLCTSNLVTTFTTSALSVACTNNATILGPLYGTGCTNPGLSDGLGNVIAFSSAKVAYCEYRGQSIIGIFVVPCFFPGFTASFPVQYTKLRCQSGLGDGLNAMAAGTYLQSFCYNDSGVTWTITGFRCFSDNNGTSTMNATNGAGTALLTGAVTCTTAFAAATQSATVIIAAGDFVKFTFVADGTSKQSTWVASFTQ